MEIERKFLIKELPDLSPKEPIRYERYFIKIENGLEERVQKKGDKYEYEIRKTISDIQRTKEKRSITEEEFIEFKKGKENEGIIRDSYLISEKPNITIKIYRGRFEGLIRAEVEFNSEEEARDYKPESWMGSEITTSPLGMDSRLLHLTPEEFKSLSNRF